VPFISSPKLVSCTFLIAYHITIICVFLRIPENVT
jgi:hypothetical protein